MVAAVICFLFFTFPSSEVSASAELLSPPPYFQDMPNIMMSAADPLETKNIRALPTDVRVGIYHGGSSKTTATFSNNDGICVIANSTTQLIVGSFEIRVVDGQITIFSIDNNEEPVLVSDYPISIMPVEYGGTILLDGSAYRGTLTFSLNGSESFSVANQLNVDEYLKGVLPHEVSPSWHIEALKAAAVASRTFALRSSSHASSGFDVCTTTHCQVYKGAGQESASTNRAIQETQNLVLMYNNSLALTPYHSSSGLYTESSSNVWGGDQSLYPYLSSVFTPYEDYRNVPNGKWETVVAKSSLHSLLKRSFPLLGEISDVFVTNLPTGRAQKVTIIDDEEQTFDITGLGKVQSFFSSFVKSSNFSIGSTYIPSDSPSGVSVITANGTYDLENVEDYVYLTANGEEHCSGFEEVYVFDGQGYGHGVGMSQYGASCMANEGFTYDEILNTYYPGTYLGVM